MQRKLKNVNVFYSIQKYSKSKIFQKKKKKVYDVHTCINWLYNHLDKK